MQIRLIIMDNNQEYANRLASHLGKMYADSLQASCVAEPAELWSQLEKGDTDILLVGEKIQLDLERLPKDLAFAYLTDDPMASMVMGEHAVSRFQKVDALYKAVIGIRKNWQPREPKPKNKPVKVAPAAPAAADKQATVQLILPASGGVGSTTVAVALATRLAASGRSVLFLPLEQYADVSLLLEGKGEYSLTDVFATIKNGDDETIHEMVRKSPTGVYFYAAAEAAHDTKKQRGADIGRLVEVLVASGRYDDIVIDVDNQLCSRLYTLVSAADRLVVVADGSQISNAKFKKLHEALITVGSNNATGYEQKLSVLFNRYNKAHFQQPDWLQAPVLGGIGDKGASDCKALVEELAQMSVFDFARQNGTGA